MFTKYILPLIAIGGLAFAAYTVVEMQRTPPPSKPLISPPVVPKFRAIAGAGLVEARLENIPIGTNVSGVVVAVRVKVGDKIKKGDELFRIDDRNLNAELAVREAKLASAKAMLHRLEIAPRKEDETAAKAALEEARARLESSRITARRSASLFRRNAGPESDYDRDRFIEDESAAAVMKLSADLGRLKTWDEDLRVAEANVQEAEANLNATKTDLDRLVVRSLTNGEILQVNVRPGQFAAAVWKEPLIVLGDVTQLNVRVDIDEQDLPLFKKGAKAVATLKGRPQVRFALSRVEKLEPYVIPKRNLTGDNAERVDTRVLQVVYALPDDRPVPIYVGQQMDVYLEAAEAAPGLNLDADPAAARPFEDDIKPSAKGKPAAPASDQRSKKHE